ncbi:hypothetical protein Hanom_Chr10g00965571 [Helianthus anomalus]
MNFVNCCLYFVLYGFYTLCVVCLDFGFALFESVGGLKGWPSPPLILYDI